MLIRREHIKRSDEVLDSTPVAGALTKVLKPKRITLVGLPSNQTPYKIIRSDTDKGEIPMTHLIRRTRRSDSQNPVLRLTFPEGNTEETVKKSLETYGMADYKVSEQDGVFVAMRSDLKSISKDGTQDIKLSPEGLTATVATPVLRSDGDEKAGLAMVCVEFDPTAFTKEDVQRWAEEKCVDGVVEEPQNPGQCYVVRRSEVPDGEEVRKLVLEDGITATIVRADSSDIPAGYVEVVSETAYGSWGWGSLDFMAAVADREFSELMENASRKLRDVLDNIVLTSRLPLDTRKELVIRALGQYGDYVNAVMDSLPRQLLASVVRSANPQQENDVKQDGASGATPEPTEAKTITREDVQSMIAELLPQAVADGVKLALATRDDKPAGEPAKEPAAVEPAAPATTETVTRSDLQELIKPLMEKVEQLASVTVVRSANEPVPVASSEPKAKDIFRGALPGLRLKETQ